MNIHCGGFLNSKSRNDYHYCKEDLVKALIDVGIKKGDIIFSHVGMGFLGYPKEGRDLDTMFDVVYGAFKEVLGKKGTILVPTYSYSFCKNEPFNVRDTPSTVGYFTEKFRKLPEAERSLEPIFSVAGIGPKTKSLIKDLPMISFGPDCIYERLLKNNAYVCNVGVGFRYATFVHYAERSVGIPYRFDKKFKGIIIDKNGKKRNAEIVYYVRNAVDDKTTLADLSRLERDVKEAGVLGSVPVGNGVVTRISCRDLFDFCLKSIKKDPWYLARGKTNMKNVLADRINDIKPPASMGMSEKVSGMKKKGREIIDLTIGEPDFDTPDKIRNAGIKAIKNGFTHYTKSKGIDELRYEIRKKLHKENRIKVDPDNNILITPGVKQALYYLNSCVINPNDEAIVIEPHWMTYIDSLLLCGGVPKTVCGEEGNDFKPTMEQIENKISERVKYIIVNNPCNPTGALWSKQELEKIVDMARKNNMLIVSDEIYEKMVFDDNKFVSMASLEGAEDITITLNGFSKSHAMTGWRVGYAVGHEEIIKAMNKVQQQIATCACSISQKAAVIANQERDDVKRMTSLYQKRRDILVNGLNKINGFECRKPKGTFYAFANITGLGMGSLEVTEYMLKEANVAVVPGIAYGKNCNNFIRLSFAASEENIEGALRNLDACFG
jgi:aspartate/methionine/tyrosine aminotransferase/aminoglycoside N3'-acetyltransferase